MRGFLLGIIVGGLTGAAATYAVIEMRQSEKGEEPMFASAAEHIDAARQGVGSEKTKTRGKKRRRGKARRGSGSPSDQVVEISAADRKMTWRGAAVRMPDKSADFAEGEGGGRSLSSSEINGGLGPVKGALSSCIADARGNANLSAKMTLKFLVSGNGRVGPVRARAPAYMHKRGLLGCVRSAVRRASFATTGAPTIVTLPFEVE